MNNFGSATLHYTVNPPLYISENARDINMNTVKAVNFRLPEFVGFQFGIMKKKSYLLVINLEL